MMRDVLHGRIAEARARRADTQPGALPWGALPESSVDEMADEMAVAFDAFFETGCPDDLVTTLEAWRATAQAYHDHPSIANPMVIGDFVEAPPPATLAEPIFTVSVRWYARNAKRRPPWPHLALFRDVPGRRMKLLARLGCDWQSLADPWLTVQQFIRDVLGDKPMMCIGRFEHSFVVIVGIAPLNMNPES